MNTLPVTGGVLIRTLVILCGISAPPAGATDKLAICYDKALTPLVSLAKLRDFYSAEGIDVELRHFPSGRQNLEAMFRGECELATAAETPTVHYSLSRPDFLILATLSTGNNFEKVIVRADRGILTPADLRGRRIAVPKLTIAHYFIDMYLLANGLSPQDVKQVYLAPQDVAPAFRNGEVDAAAFWEPGIQLLAEEFGARAKLFSAPGLHVIPFMLVGNRDYVRKNPDAIKRVLGALVRAERFVKEQPANAKALLASAFKVAQRDLDLIWSLQDLRISLDQSLPFILENAARWEIGTLPSAQRPVLPNYLNFIYLDGLRAAKPAAVTIIH